MAASLAPQQFPNRHLQSSSSPTRTEWSKPTLENAAMRSEIIKTIDEVGELGKGTVTTKDSLSATWPLLWTTEQEQLFIIEKAGLFRTATGDVLQVTDVKKGLLSNVISFSSDGVFFVMSTIEIASARRVNFRFDTIYLDNEIRVVKDIRDDYLVVERAPYGWKE